MSDYLIEFFRPSFYYDCLTALGLQEKDNPYTNHGRFTEDMTKWP